MAEKTLFAKLKRGLFMTHTEIIEKVKESMTPDVPIGREARLFPVAQPRNELQRDVDRRTVVRGRRHRLHANRGARRVVVEMKASTGLASGAMGAESIICPFQLPQLGLHWRKHESILDGVSRGHGTAGGLFWSSRSDGNGRRNSVHFYN